MPLDSDDLAHVTAFLLAAVGWAGRAGDMATELEWRGSGSPGRLENQRPTPTLCKDKSAMTTTTTNAYGH